MGHMDLASAFSGFSAAIALRKKRSDAASRALSRWRHPVLVAALETWSHEIQRVKVVSRASSRAALWLPDWSKGHWSHYPSGFD